MNLQRWENSRESGSDRAARRRPVGARVRLAATIGLLVVLLAGPQVASGFQTDDSTSHSITLVDISFAAGALHGGEGSHLLRISANEVAPGGSLFNTFRCTPDEVLVVHVLSGAMTIRVAGLSHVLRAEDTAWEPVPGGSETELTAGGTWVLRHVFDDDLGGVRNETAQPLKLLWLPIWDMNPDCSPAGPGNGYLWSQTEMDPPLAANEPIRFRARWVNVPPGPSLPDGVVDILTPLSEEDRARGERRWVRIESGAVELVYLPRLPEDSLEPSSVFVRAGTLLGDSMPLQPRIDREMQFRNGGDAPLELIVFEVMVGGQQASSGILAPSWESPD